jgi:hypothetical protein
MPLTVRDGNINSAHYQVDDHDDPPLPCRHRAITRRRYQQEHPMNKTTFLEYIDAYNSGDVDRVLSYYDADIVFENFGRHQRGAAVGEFLRGLHHVIRDFMVPRTIVMEGDMIALEADSEITAFIDLPQLPIGAMTKGEKGRVRMFVFYQTKGDRFSHIRIAGWPIVPSG